MIKGVDVSEHNGEIDWHVMKENGIEFAIVRCTYGKHEVDENFIENVRNAHAVGIKCGAYHYSYALSIEDAVIEAEHCREVIDNSGLLLELPVFFDMEDADGYKERHGFNFDFNEITAICRAFITHLGLNCGVYASYSWLESYIDWVSLGCAVWNAQWSSNDDFKGYMWQFTDNMYIPTGNEKYDGNYMYVDTL